MPEDQSISTIRVPNLQLRDPALHDNIRSKQAARPGTLSVTVVNDGRTIEIMPQGYGVCEMEPGFAAPIALELYEGHLRLMVWSDINREDCTVIDMEGARESARIT